MKKPFTEVEFTEETNNENENYYLMLDETRNVWITSDDMEWRLQMVTTTYEKVHTAVYTTEAIYIDCPINICAYE